MKTMVDNAKIARMEKDIKETDAKVKNINKVPPSTTADAGKVLTVNEDGSLSWQVKGVGGGMKAFFDAGGKCAYSNVTSYENIIGYGDTSDVLDMSDFFIGNSMITTIPSIDTSKVTTMENMFKECIRIESIPSIDTSKVTNMKYIFGNCRQLRNVPAIDTSNVTTMKSMFENCGNLMSIPYVDTSNVTNMNSMFYGCRQIRSIPNLNAINVNDATYMLGDCRMLEAIHMKNIGVNLKIDSSTKFTREALLEIIGNLKTVTTTKTLTMGSTNLAKLTEEDKTIATNKGWTLA